MNPRLLNFVRNNDWTGFLQEYLTQNPRTTLTPQGIRTLFDGARLGPTATGNAPTTNYLPQTNGNGIFGTLNNGIKGVGGVANTLYQSQIGQGASTQNYESIKKLFELIEKGGLSFSTITEGVKLIGDEIINQLKQESELKSDINTKTTLTKDLSEDLRKDMLESSISAAQFGLSVKDLGDIYTSLVEKSGKFSLLNKETLDNAAPIIKVFVDGSRELGNAIYEFEKVGIGANKTIKIIEDAGVKSMSLGLNGRKTVSDIRENLDKVNQFGFKNGIQGLADMTRRATEFRMTMQGAFDLAEKVMSPEGALELTANLQVLGGAIGDFNDPLKLMYMATNNVEGLQDAIIDAASSLATYNEEQGRFEITGINLRKAREMAKQLGMDYKDLANGVIATAERTSAATALMTTGLQLKPDDKEFLTNLSQMEGGEMVIKIPESIAQKLGVPTKIALEHLDKNTADALLKNQKDFKTMSAAEIAKEQLTETEQMARNVDVIAAYVKIRAAQGLRGVARGTGLENAYKTIRESIAGTAKDIIGKKSEPNFDKKIEGKVDDGINYLKEKKNEYIDQPLKDAKDWIKNKTGVDLGKNDTEKTMKITHEHFFRTPNIADNISREMVKGNMMMPEDPNPRGYLGKNKINNSYV